ncbi:hypothetical protein BGZ72_005538 [Mortierella alpina]|nr:hypothetical protein BGZ72_005538 [Mortierella alpina]
MEAVDDGLVDAKAVAFMCGETCGVSACLLAMDAAVAVAAAVTESAGTECDNEAAVDACEIPTEEARGLKEACDNTGVVDEDSGEGYMGLKRWP